MPHLHSRSLFLMKGYEPRSLDRQARLPRLLGVSAAEDTAVDSAWQHTGRPSHALRRLPVRGTTFRMAHGVSLPSGGYRRDGAEFSARASATCSRWLIGSLARGDVAYKRSLLVGLSG